MGKISDALERQQRDKAIKSQMLFRNPTKEFKKKVSSSNLKRELSSQLMADPKLIVYTAPGSVEAENFKVLRTKILFQKTPVV